MNALSQEPVKSTELPKGPWENLAVDYYGPLPSGDYVLVVTDEYSRFADISFTTSTSAKATTPKLDRIFSSYGIPLHLKSDNGAPFNSDMFSDYCKFTEIKHHTSTPLHPQLSCDTLRYHWEVSGRSIVSKQDVSGTITGVIQISE